MLNETRGLARGRLEFSKMMPEINPGVIQSKKKKKTLANPNLKL